MTQLKLTKAIRGLSGTLGFILAGLAAALLFGVPRVPEVLAAAGPSVYVLGSGGTLLLWSLLSPGQKHTPYWITTAAGVLLLLLSLDMGFRNVSGAGRAAFLFQDGPAAAAGLMLLTAGRAVSSRVMLNPRKYYPAAAVALLAVVGLFTGLGAPGRGADEGERIELSYREGRAVLLSLLRPEAGDAAAEDAQAGTEDAQAGSESADVDSVAEADSGAGEAEARSEEESPEPPAVTVVQVDGGEVFPVGSFREAVRPDVPMVRDFAIAIAAEHPGSYYRSSAYVNPEPGVTGVRQVVSIHSYISGNWKYVNDPMFTDGEYYSPAHRTLAAGLAGDCDDYSILMASAVEAVGGKARILGGTCNEGGHAWPEVFIGSSSAWNDAMKVVSSVYPGRRIEYLKDSSGEYWLSLDWELGTLSCGGSPEIIYQSDWR